MRIKTIEIENFRAFSAPAKIEVDSKNLLVFGENGAGKSSIYHAIEGFFSTDIPQIATNVNLFQQVVFPSCEASVKVTFDDGTPAVIWGVQHPGRLYGDQRVINASQRSAIIDYRSLLRTNFSFGDDPLNWFYIIHRELVPDFRSIGGQPTLRDLWRNVQGLTSNITSQQRPTSNRLVGALKPKIHKACSDFTSSYRSALTNLETSVTPILSELSESSISISFPVYAGLTYNEPWSNRGLRGASYEPEITFRTLPRLTRPQLFLNEARQSQIALAVYLAGRKAVVPAGATPHLNLLVLDDVLIGLDHSNRVPLLKLLSNQFRDWQIILLTHDRVWFDMARTMLHKQSWTCVEVIEGDVQGVPAPFVRTTDVEAPVALLDQATKFLFDGHLGASANCARSAFELKLRLLCDDLGVKVPFKRLAKKFTMDSLIGSLTDWIKDNKEYHSWDKILKQATYYKDLVLNPQSHPLPELILRAEVREAIRSVGAFIELKKDQPVAPSTLADLQTLLSMGPITDEQARSGISMLRAAWKASVQQFCERKNVRFTLSEFPPDTRKMFETSWSQFPNDLKSNGIVDNDKPELIKWLCDSILEDDIPKINNALIRAKSALVCKPTFSGIYLDDR